MGQLMSQSLPLATQVLFPSCVDVGGSSEHNEHTVAGNLCLTGAACYALMSGSGKCCKLSYFLYLIKGLLGVSPMISQKLDFPQTRETYEQVCSIACLPLIGVQASMKCSMGHEIVLLLAAVPMISLADKMLLQQLDLDPRVLNVTHKMCIFSIFCMSVMNKVPMGILLCTTFCFLEVNERPQHPGFKEMYQAIACTLAAITFSSAPCSFDTGSTIPIPE